MYESPAHEICDNLGFTPEEAQMSAESVAARIDRVDNWDDVTTTAELAGQTRVHLHQLVEDSANHKWIILGLNNDTVELTKVRIPDDGGRISFMEDRTISHGRFIMDYKPLTESFLESRFGEPKEVPVWGY